MNRIGHRTAILSCALLLAACGGGSEESFAPDAGAPPDAGTPPDNSACTLTANTTQTMKANANGCYVLTRDTSSCLATRQAAGLSGAWLKFSCRVQLTRTTSGGVTADVAAADGQPDYKSFYFATNDPCYEAWAQGNHNPSTLSAQSYSVSFPASPNTTAQSMMGNAVVGLAVNGVPMFSNFAAPGDDIYAEAVSFDKCDGHPQNHGVYHYHSEPNAISDDDANLVGVMRDGYAVYGRKDGNGTYPTLDTYGGHTGTTPDSMTPVYHYHVNKQTSTHPGTSGQTQWFLTTGTWRGTPGACMGGC